MSVAGKKVADFKLLRSEWHPTLNGDLTPRSVAAGSNHTVWWRCARGHEFQRSPNGRTNNGRAIGRVSGCPRCASESGGLDYWSWEKIVEVATKVAKKEGFLPPASYFQQNGLAMLTTCLYAHGRTWDDLRQRVGSYEGSSFCPSRAGIRWRSRAEASLSNFLFARGIRHQKGRKYPPAYAAFSGRAYGYFDLLFHDLHGAPIDVEIWGDKPYGHAEAKYAAKRDAKERFNRGRRNFLGIHFADCYQDARLTKILRPFLGVLRPRMFVKPSDKQVETAHWSDADELLATCREIAAAQPDGKFPPEDWLRKRGRWAHRDGPAYNTVSVYIKLWLGGVRNLRQLLGQGHLSTKRWDRDAALKELRGWYRMYGRAPDAVRGDRMFANQPDVTRAAARLAHAVRKYVGSMAEACVAIGIRPTPWAVEAGVRRDRRLMRKPRRG